MLVLQPTYTKYEIVHFQITNEESASYSEVPDFCNEVVNISTPLFIMATARKSSNCHA